MASIVIEIDELQNRFAEVVSLVANGTAVEIHSGGQALSLKIPADVVHTHGMARKKRIAGLHAGQGWIAEDFGAPLPDEFWLGKHELLT